MVPQGFANFFTGSAGASATLVGLLFVAISIGPERVFGSGALADRHVAASGAFTALVNVFFISLGAIIPGMPLGGFVLAMGAFALLHTLSLAQTLWRRRLEGWLTGRGTVLVIGSFVIYGLESWYGRLLLVAPSDTDYLSFLAMLLLIVYGIALGRAWELLGAPRRGLLAWLFSPHEREDDGRAPPDNSGAPSRQKPGDRGP